MTSGGVVTRGSERRKVCEMAVVWRESGLNIDARLEENFDDRDAVQRLRFDVFDVVEPAW